MTITIGIDPHKASHTAVAIDNTEHVLDELRVRACAKQAEQLRTWATPFPDRVWAIESARGLGYLLVQQLVAAGETVIDVPAVLSTRARLLGVLVHCVGDGHGVDTPLGVHRAQDSMVVRSQPCSRLVRREPHCRRPVAMGM
jgi:hypothetical protein